MVYNGQCLCGQTKITVAGPAQDKQIACHCLDCQLTSGSAHSTNILPKQSDVTITGAVKEYNSKAASGNTVTRVFCGNCGAAVAHKSAAFGDAMAIQTGLIPDFRTIPFAAELFVKDRWTGLAAIEGADQAQTMPGA